MGEQELQIMDEATRAKLWLVLSERGLSEVEIKAVLSAIREIGLTKEITEFRALSVGMTNRLFFMTSGGQDFIVRAPGEGSEQLLDRKNETRIYLAFEGLGLTEVCRYINPYTGVKITEFLRGSHVCDPKNREEVKTCMQLLHYLHSRKIKNFERFDIRDRILQYEGELQHDPASRLANYEAVKREVLEKLDAIEAMQPEEYLCHMDAVYDNFLIKDGVAHLIDWEYAALADPHLDLAMFAIYADYDKAETDHLIDAYYAPYSCPMTIRRKIYDYMAIGGFLWTLWCELKHDAGVDYEAYEAKQYKYASEPF